MKRVVETPEQELEALLGEKVLFMCAGYFYYGKLTGVNDTRVEIEDPSIVYETGTWDGKAWQDSQRLPTKHAYVRLAAVEAYIKVER